MKPDLSEFSYGYALTEDFIRSRNMALTAAPVFPSLQEEGKTGGGWDLKLKRPGMPLFLQFKTSHCMQRLGNTTEYKRGLFSSAFYRFHLRPRNRSNQHEMLLDLESKGNEVYYVAPMFHRIEELNDAYLNKTVANRSRFFRPSTIGTLPDDKEHHVSFQAMSTFYVLSEPQERTGALDFATFARHITGTFERRARVLTEDNLAELSRQMLQIVEQNPQPPIPDSEETGQDRLLSENVHHPRLYSMVDETVLAEQRAFTLSLRNLQQLSPLDQASYAARAFFNCQLLIVSQRDTDADAAST